MQHCWPTTPNIALSSSRVPSSRALALRSDEGLTLETSAFRISVRWPIYIINSVDKTKFLYTTSPPTQHHSFFRNYPFNSKHCWPTTPNIVVQQLPTLLANSSQHCCATTPNIVGQQLRTLLGNNSQHCCATTPNIVGQQLPMLFGVTRCVHVPL